MKLLITGGAGFQGSHLARHFIKEGHDVTILNTFSDNSERNIADIRNDVRVVWGSITDKEIVTKTVRKMDAVFHLAARINVDESIEDPLSYIEVNVKGTFNVLEAVRKEGTRMIHASTCEVYGAPVSADKIKEDLELRPYSPYAASKAGADRLCFAYHKTYGVDVSIVRPFNIYGEFQKEGKGGAVIAIFVNKALKGEPLKVFGSGDQTRDYMYISDLVNAYDLVLKNKNSVGEVFNFGSGEEISVKQIAEAVKTEFGVEIIYEEARAGEVERFCADISKAEAIGFKPEVTFKKGLRKYIDWRKNL